MVLTRDETEVPCEQRVIAGLLKREAPRAANSSGFALIDLFIILLLPHAGQSFRRFLAPGSVFAKPANSRNRDHAVGNNDGGSTTSRVVHGFFSLDSIFVVAVVTTYPCLSACGVEPSSISSGGLCHHGVGGQPKQ